MDKEDIKVWLTEAGKSREWLADECGVSVATVNGWLSAGRSIPGPALRIIERLRNGAPELNPRLSVTELLAAQQKARAMGLTLDEWLGELIRKEVLPPRSGSSGSGGVGKK